MKSAERYVGIEVHAFGHGMYTLFQGVAEVFSSLGIKPPETVAEQTDKWNPEKEGKDADAASTENTGTESSDSDDALNHPDDATNAVTKDETADDGKDDKGSQDTEKPAAKPKKKKAEADAPTLSQDDITKIIVQKIKQDRGNSARIEQLLNAHGAARVSDLDPSTYEAFITDLVAL